MAVKIASFTRRMEIITSVCVLPLHDMRTFAGDSIQADILCEGRLILGVGRGAFAYPSGVSSALAGINPALDFFN
jgi:alkanesulfonate monooxygenase SsuD/methylene tetrahydromethanopterin reductase-like flavin-dependent oxidoreductase (luciferase family)